MRAISVKKENDQLKKEIIKLKAKVRGMDWRDKFWSWIGERIIKFKVKIKKVIYENYIFRKFRS